MPSFTVPVQGQGKGETSMPSFGASAVQDVSQLQLSCFRFELFLISLYCRKQRGERTEVQLAGIYYCLC